MKSKNVFYVIIMLCVSAGFLRAQDSVPLPPGYGGGQDSVPPPPGYGGRMGMVPVEQDEFSSIVGARCLLKVSCDPSILRLDYTTIKRIVMYCRIAILCPDLTPIRAPSCLLIVRVRLQK
jgi:hypothetical protein